MQVSLSTFLWLIKAFLSNCPSSQFSIDFDNLRQTIFQAQSDGHITVAEGFEILEAVYTMVMPASPFEEQKGPSSLGIALAPEPSDGTRGRS